MSNSLLDITILNLLMCSIALLVAKPKDLQASDQELMISDDTRIIETVTNAFTGIKININHSIINTPRSELVIYRGTESIELNVGEGVNISDFATASQTNLAYALVSKYHKYGDGYGSSEKKLISIKLPQKDRPLSEVVISTVIDTNELNTDEGRVWISEIKDVSNDGKRLLVEKSVPRNANRKTTTYEYKIMILDVLKKEFEELKWNRIDGNRIDLHKEEANPEGYLLRTKLISYSVPKLWLYKNGGIPRLWSYYVPERVVGLRT